MSPDSNSCVLFFVKYPLPGRVKTRLAKKLGQDRAAELYRNSVLDILDTLQTLNVKLRIFFEPPDALDKCRHWLGKDHSYVLQIGPDLGQKMKNAFIHAFAEGFSKLVLIGSDLPDLPASFLNLSLEALDTHDTVIGPTSDGGYYLIGFSKQAFLPEVFEGIAWGTDRVFMHTLKILDRHEQKLYILPQWHDVDTLDDVNEMLKRNKNTAFTPSRTLSCILGINGELSKSKHQISTDKHCACSLKIGDCEKRQC
ncbi:MAG TPA: TIGR04282 family arsenosugar biosynthesis glycosyltransferase [Sedimentisphaerales bacterium]|nr:TIGR04282 family arsenosugar biosynthesis glycosyltransferase [Sedimentisphaerales bacterium]